MHRIVGDVEGDIRHVQKVVGKVLLDDITFVAAADNKLVYFMEGVELHDMPENRLTADLDHGLGLDVGFLGNARPETTSEDDCLHFRINLTFSKWRFRFMNFTDNPDRDWEIWGKTIPYFGVLTDPKYLDANLNDNSLLEFFASGERHVEHIYSVIRANIQPDF